ncbi:MAG: hypothetical protein ABIL11_03750 [Chloroflexota bacterium]
MEVAWRAVKADPHWKRHFEELKKRMHPNQAIVTIAHHLLVVVWYVLTKHEPYRHYGSRLRYHYSPERIAYRVGAAHKYLTWSWALDEEQRQGMTRPQPVLASGQGLRATIVRLSSRRSLMRLGIGNELKRVALNPEFPYRLASVEEVLALRPELQPPE